ncbi:hypothetical protein N7539_003797 [Penicillium diatomitis]|uniref:Uncharacterized protein n=1 Tax=Penicillium diatomitis TaxID=2819901 RepID=A0A9X0BY74_9EURO|nr:uncharacterized protein N7539_003797 [Penicillium diatomitis]KAJ5488907.1 hypothetical protein N7539_003797 [Penicillium diatomitis]
MLTDPYLEDVKVEPGGEGSWATDGESNRSLWRIHKVTRCSGEGTQEAKRSDCVSAVEHRVTLRFYGLGPLNGAGCEV